MYDYGMVKSIHDQRMRQFMIEAERAHLLRQLRQNRGSQHSVADRLLARMRQVGEAVVVAIRPQELAG